MAQATSARTGVAARTVESLYAASRRPPSASTASAVMPRRRTALRSWRSARASICVLTAQSQGVRRSKRDRMRRSVASARIGAPRTVGSARLRASHSFTQASPVPPVASAPPSRKNSTAVTLLRAAPAFGFLPVVDGGSCAFCAAAASCA
jgi:hypothetical protein